MAKSTGGYCFNPVTLKDAMRLNEVEVLHVNVVLLREDVELLQDGVEQLPGDFDQYGTRLGPVWVLERLEIVKAMRGEAVQLEMNVVELKLGDEGVGQLLIDSYNATTQDAEHRVQLEETAAEARVEMVRIGAAREEQLGDVRAQVGCNRDPSRPCALFAGFPALG